MGYFWQHERQIQEQYAFIPCAPGCRGSESSPRHCDCVCRGLNHGILIHPRPVQPVPVPNGYNLYLAMQQAPEYPQLEQQKQLPEIRPKIQFSPSDRLVGHATKSLGKKIGHSLKVSIAGYSQDDINAMVLNGLKKQFRKNE